MGAGASANDGGMKLLRHALLPVLGSLAVSATAHADEDITKSFTNDASGAIPTGMPDPTGVVERVVSWVDKQGEHAAVFSHVEKEGTKGGDKYWSKSLYVTTWIRTGMKMKQVREVKEVMPPCPLDLTARFIDASIGLTDLDQNGKGELTFGYVTRCAGDVSPMSMKVLVLEGDKKWILRGESKVDVGGGEIVGGSYKPDFAKAPPAFLEHAKAVWDKHVGP